MTDEEADEQVIEGESNVTDSATPSVIATPEQILAGHRVGTPRYPAICNSCRTAFGETDIVLAYAYRSSGSLQWDVPRLFCWGCAPNTIQTPTLGTTEVLVAGRIGSLSLPTSRSHRLCLTELAIRAFSPPTEGSER